MKAPVNMQKIAKQAGVSLGTVSHVINDTVPVREHLRKRVLEAVRALGYQPSQLARGLRRNATDMIGMVVSDITNPFFPAVVRGAEDIAYGESFRLVLCNSDNDPMKELSYLNQLRSFRPAGMIIIPSLGSTILSQLTPHDGPIIFADRCPDGWEGDLVIVANEPGAYAATQFLIDHGHQQLSAIVGPSDFSNSRERLSGFRKAIANAGLHVSPEYIQQGYFDQRSGRDCMRRLLSLTPRPTAVFTANDLMGAGALTAMYEAGVRCPEEMSLFSFDNLDFADVTGPPLSTVHQPGYQMGSNAARLLLERIRSEEELPPRRIVLDTELRIRQSVGYVPEKPRLSTSGPRSAGERLAARKRRRSD